MFYLTIFNFSNHPKTCGTSHSFHSLSKVRVSYTVGCALEAVYVMKPHFFSEMSSSEMLVAIIKLRRAVFLLNAKQPSSFKEPQLF